MGRYDLSEADWRLIEPLLPNKLRGAARVDDRRVIDRILRRQGTSMGAAHFGMGRKRENVMRISRLVSVLAVAWPALAVVPAAADEWVMACAEGSPPCAIDGTRMVQYGANGRFHFGVATNRMVCSNETFGDPVPGVAKACWYKKTASEQSLEAMVAERDNQIAQLAAQVGQLTAQSGPLTGQVTQLTRNVEALQRENRDLKTDLRKANNQIDKLQNDLRKANSQRSLPPMDWKEWGK